MKDSKAYRLLGVSSGKEDIVAATHHQGEGLFPGAFCKIIDDVFVGDEEYCAAFHADGAGTKSIVAYLDFKEHGDPNVFASLAQDALVMNIDDLLCIGACGPFAVTNTIGRHRELIPSDVIEAIIKGYQKCAAKLGEYGVDVRLCGGETADVGDLVRTAIVDASVACRLRRDHVIDGSLVSDGDLIIGLSSCGRTIYEEELNSGIGSNGLTLARHVLLSNKYSKKYKEVSAPELDPDLAYRGPFDLDDRPKELDWLGITISQALLSPTRTYAPVIVRILQTMKSSIHGLVHCTGGGQTKCMRFNSSLQYIKDRLFPTPSIFRIIQQAAQLEWKEMYQVFNMGHRMELFVDPGAADEVQAIANGFGLATKVIGRCKPRDKGPQLIIQGPDGPIVY